MSIVPEPELPSIQVNDRQLRDLTTDCMNALEIANRPSFLFIRGSDLVHVTAPEIEKRRRARVGLIREPQLRHYLTRAANFHRIVEGKKGPVYIDASPPGDAIHDILAMPEKCDFPVLDGITEVPVVRTDGSVLDIPGYDEVLKLYYFPSCVKRLPKVPADPTPADVERSVALLDELLCDFPFQNAASSANARALLLTPLIRPVIAPCNVPLFVVDANQAGAGKGLLVDLVSLIFTGTLSAIKPAPDAGRNAEDEMRKLLLSVCLSGSPITVLDNLDGVLKSATLAAAVTASEINDRLLGHSRMICVPQRTTFIVTGNNVMLGGDMPRRCVWVRLEVETARPFLRTGFRHPKLKKWVLSHRAELLSALLVLVSAFYKAGSPRSDQTPTLGSFEEWAATVGGILAFAEIEGFLGNSVEQYNQADPTEAQWEAFLTAIHESFGVAKFTVKELQSRMTRSLNPANPLRQTLPDELGEGCSEGTGSLERRLGHAFLRVASRRYGSKNIRVEKAGKAHGRATWIVRRDV